jgi:hypothetical protein
MRDVTTERTLSRTVLARLSRFLACHVSLLGKVAPGQILSKKTEPHHFPSSTCVTKESHDEEKVLLGKAVYAILCEDEKEQGALHHVRREAFMSIFWKQVPK